MPRVLALGLFFRGCFLGGRFFSGSFLGGRFFSGSFSFSFSFRLGDDFLAAFDRLVAALRFDRSLLGDGFLGGGQVAMGDLADALGRVRASGKPVVAYATAYTDDGYQLAAAASEVWLNPLGLVAVVLAVQLSIGILVGRPRYVLDGAAPDGTVSRGKRAPLR